MAEDLIEEPLMTFVGHRIFTAQSDPPNLCPRAFYSSFLDCRGDGPSETADIAFHPKPAAPADGRRRRRAKYIRGSISSASPVRSILTWSAGRMIQTIVYAVEGEAAGLRCGDFAILRTAI